MGHIRDRWMTRNAQGRKIRTERWGKGKRWQARWIGPDGRERVQACATRDEAENLIAGIRAGVPEHRRADLTTFDAYARRWLADQLHYRPSTAEATASKVRRHIIPAFDAKAPGEITRAEVQQVVSQWSQQMAASTVRIVYSHLHSIMASATADGLIAASPCVKIKLPPKPMRDPFLLTTEQVAQIVAAMTPTGRSMVIVAAATGMRQGELTGLTWDRIDSDGVVSVDRQGLGDGTWGPPKSAAGRRKIPMGPSAWRVLQAERPQDASTELVWTARTGKMLDRTAMGDRWRAATKGMGLPPHTGWHLLRDYHASLLIAAGLSPRTVADRLGHADVSETLNTYSRLWPSDQARAVSAIEAELGIVFEL